MISIVGWVEQSETQRSFIPYGRIKINLSNSPVLIVYASINGLIKTRKFPFLWRFHITMLHGIVVYIFNVPNEILFISDLVFPKAALLYRLLFFALSRK